MILPKVDPPERNPLPGLITSRSLEAASETLARAFHADPIFAHFFPDETTRDQHSRQVFKLQLRQGWQFGEVQITSPNCEGVAVWLPVDKIDLDFISYLKLGGLELLRRTGLGNLIRMLTASQHLTALHRRCFPPNGHYLALLGVNPAHQGQGHARNLLDAMLARLDVARRPGCLETENARNLPLYQRFGFRVVEETRLAKSNVRCWVMVRDGRPRAQRR